MQPIPDSAPLVLIIDDHPQAATMILEHAGLYVHIVECAESAVACLRVMMFDVVLLDLCLPGSKPFGDHFAFARKIRELHTGKIIIISGLDRHFLGTVAHAIDAIAVPKPFLSGDLLRALGLDAPSRSP